jgi:hypothetical protein
MFQSLKNDCGAKVIHRSHENSLPSRSLEMFTMLGNNRDILTLFSGNKIGQVEKVDDTYKSGIQKLKNMICIDKDLKRFKKHIYYHFEPQADSESTNVTIGDLPDASDAGDSQSEDM